MKTRLAAVVGLFLLSACATLPTPVTVIATGETGVATADARDRPGNPTLWKGGMTRRDPGVAQDGFLASTTSGGALVIHDFQGAELQRVSGPPLHDIDVSAVPLPASYAVIVAGTETVRGRARIGLYRLDPGERETVRRWGQIDTDMAAPRGFCMRQVDGVLIAVAMDRRGEVRQFEISEGANGEAVSREMRRYRLDRAGEGCAIDPLSRSIYFSHARAGFWRSTVAPSADATPVRLVDASARRLPRSRGAVYLTSNRNRYLASLDQDHAAFSVWRLERDSLVWAGRFEVREHADGRTVRSLAGLDAYGGELGPFPDGVVVVQDQANDGTPNLKFINWTEVSRALGL
ncbi:MAG: phytase [Brevundimonas sp.]|nr:MAG: phytase [Brevundimonas sp.]